jgi:hypothetical protein
MRWLRVVRAFSLTLTLVVLVYTPAAGQGASVTYDVFFAERTMRVDYFHTGNATTEIVSLDRVVADGPWAGSKKRLLDDTNLGKYFFEVRDTESERLLYSRGFASIYGEWETTGEAKIMYRTFHESLRFPWPKRPVRISLQKRDPDQRFVEIASLELDPAARSVNPADLTPIGKTWTLFEHGHPSEKVDLVVLGEGYTDAELPKFHADAERLVGALFRYEPFKSHKTKFNVRAIDLPAAESGISRPHGGKFRRNPVGTRYSIFDSERYVLTLDNRTMRDVLSAVPYEFVVILVNERQYGGGGIYNLQATAAVGSEFAEYLFIHEFGHHFAALADEYFTSPVAYETGGVEHIEPWEPNVTALHDPAQLKWGDLVEPGVPIPTSWEKARFEEHARWILERRQQLIAEQAPEEEFDAFFREQREIEQNMLSSMQYSGKVGAFEGASYEPRGLYRSEIDCIMFSRNMIRFCKVCQRAILRIIGLYSSN